MILIIFFDDKHMSRAGYWLASTAYIYQENNQPIQTCQDCRDIIKYIRLTKITSRQYALACVVVNRIPKYKYHIYHDKYYWFPALQPDGILSEYFEVLHICILSSLLHCQLSRNYLILTD